MFKIFKIDLSLLKDLLEALLSFVNIDADDYLCAVSNRIRVWVNPFCGVQVCFVQETCEKIDDVETASDKSYTEFCSVILHMFWWH